MNVAARVIAAREAVAAGELVYAQGLLEDLEHDLLRKARRPHRCENCGRSFRFPGELEHHRFEAHSWSST